VPATRVQCYVITLSESAHTYGPDCPLCGDGRSGTRCDLSAYSVRRVRFLLAHRTAFEAAYLNSDKRAASHELVRLETEYRTLPPRHSCSCVCPNVTHGRLRCDECKRLEAQRPNGPDIGVELGHTAIVTPPMPSAMMLDLERAIAVIGIDNPVAIAKYMSLNGTSVAANIPPLAPPTPQSIEDNPLEPRLPSHHPSRRPVSGQVVGSNATRPVMVEREVLCLMCSRDGAIGQRQCQWCGGSLVLVTVA
jgi:hypothetical protein